MRKLFVFGLIGLLPFCRSNNHSLKDTPKYDSVNVDTNFKKQFAFQLLDNEEGFTGINESGKEVKSKKSCEVMLIRIDDKRDKIFPSRYHDCEAELIKDTIKIDIGFNSGLGASGIYISVAGGKFYAEPYEFSDNIVLGEKEPSFRVEKQKLVLSKGEFSLGDSLFGHIYSRVKDDKNVKYYTVGFFRTTVSKR